MNITLTNSIDTSRYGRISLYNTKNFPAKNLYLKNEISQDLFVKNSTVQAPKKFSFTGITQTFPQVKINSLSDIIGMWEKLKWSPYYEALDDKIYSQNKYLRMQNFAFLDEVPYRLKGEFVEYFKKITGFPNFKTVTQNIENEYVRVVNSAAESISPDVKVIAAGYDPTCSVGLGKPFPGSDLDKAFVVLHNRSWLNDSEVVNRYKGHLWFNTDQRFLSLNNEDTFPEVYTLGQVRDTLRSLDQIVDNMWISKSVANEFERLRYNELEPEKAGLFNIMVAGHLPSMGISKEYAKNFAYFIESVRDGKFLISNSVLMPHLTEFTENSQFVRFSDVTQTSARKILLSRSLKLPKSKLRYRENLERNFDRMNVNEQYDLIKDIIKGVSKDNDNPRFRKYFENDDNIKERYDKLNRKLLL